MAKDTEIIPIWFSGKPIYRYLRPYFISATVLMLFSLFINHFIVPNANKARLDFEEKYYRDVMVVDDYHAEYPNNQSVFFSNYNDRDKRINDFTFQQWTSDHKPSCFIKSRYALNKPGSSIWQLKDLYIKNFYKDHIEIRHLKTLDTSFNFTISEMAHRESAAATMSFSELKSFIKREKTKGSSMVPMYEIELHQRTSYPFAAYILTLIGVSVASTKRRGTLFFSSKCRTLPRLVLLLALFGGFRGSTLFGGFRGSTLFGGFRGSTLLFFSKFRNNNVS